MTHVIQIKDKAHYDALVSGRKGFLMIKPDRRIIEDDTIVLQCTVQHWYADEGKENEITKEQAIALAGPGKDNKPQDVACDAQEDYEKYFTAVELATDDETPGLKSGWQCISLKSKEV